MTIHANVRRDKIPIWINVISILVVLILLFKTYAAFVQPALTYGTIDADNIANQKVLWELAGRNIAMMVVTLLAMRSQNALFLAFTMIMNIVRESFDLLMQLCYSQGDIKLMLQACSFLVFIIPYFFALKKLRTLARQ